MHHIKDDHGWEFAHGVTLPLPVILYSKDRGLEVFSSSRLAHGASVQWLQKCTRQNSPGE